jgi:outer membrane lipoprotein-sorting protein
MKPAGDLRLKTSEVIYMRNYFRTGLIILAIAFVFGGFAAVQTSAQINDILKRMDEHYKLLKTLRTNVTYEKYDSVLTDTTTRQGKAIYALQKGKNPLIRIDWVKPEESLAVIDKKYTLYQPKLKQAFVGSTDNVKNKNSSVSSPLAFINMSKEELKANYSMRYIGEEKVNGTTPTWHLELTPKTAQKYKVADIWVDGNGMPIQMKITAGNNDTETVLLTGIEKNVQIKASVFQINPPPGTKINEN